MRLWHFKLIPYLPRQQLLGQHRECCALRGKGWGRKHSTVNYVFKHSFYLLFWYHEKVMHEMNKRGYKWSLPWVSLYYRGKQLGRVKNLPNQDIEEKSCNYPEHDDKYLQECIDNLKQKGIDLKYFND